MRISDRYIGGQVLRATFFAILFLSAIMVLGTMVQQIRMLLVEFDAPLGDIFKLMLGALPFSLIYTIPWAFLCAVLLVYGRMSKDQELTGFRVAGMGLLRLSAPVFLIGAALSALSLWLNTEVSPRAASQENSIKVDAFMNNPLRVLHAAVEQDALDRIEGRMKGLKAYISRSHDGMMDGLHVFRTPSDKTPGAAPVYVYARQAKPDADKAKKEFRFHLYDAVVLTTDKNGQPNPVVSDEIVPMVLPYEVNEEKAKKTKAMTNQQIRDYVVSDDFNDLGMKPAVKKEVELRYLGEIPRRFSNSFACLAFAFIGVPLGIGTRRRDTSTGLILSLAIGTAYFALSNMNGHSMTSMVALAWAPNAVCLALGLYLFRRARLR